MNYFTKPFAIIALALLVLDCSNSRSTETYKNVGEPVLVPVENMVLQEKYTAQQQFNLGLQAMLSEDWGVAEQHLEQALVTLLNTQSSLVSPSDSLEFFDEVNEIVVALQKTLDNMVVPADSEDYLPEIPLDAEASVDLEAMFASIDTTDVTPLDAFFDTLSLDQFSLPVELNERVMREVNFLSKSVRAFTEGSLSRKTEFEDMIWEKLAAKDMPADLINLALVESGFKTKAYSRAKASGLWQFIPATGKRYGLEVDFWVDMRRNPEMATDAALSYLQDLYNEFGDWLLAMAAYNCGEGRVRRLVRAAEGEVTFWDLKLPKETMHYVPRILAATIISKYPEYFDFKPEVVVAPQYDTASVTDCVPLQNIADAVGVSLKEISSLNRELTRWCTPPNAKSYTLRLPPNTRDQFVAAYAKMDKTKFARWHYHQVRSGENLGVIARSYGLSVSALQQANGIKGSLIRVGQNLLIPLPGHAKGAQVNPSVPVAAKTPVKSGANSNAAPHSNNSYKVRSGDNLGLIARRFGCSIQELKEWNNLSSDNLAVNQVLQVRKPKAENASVAPKPGVVTTAYTVQSGETYYSIGQRYGLSANDLMGLNHTTSSGLKPGQVIRVPAVKASAGTKTNTQGVVYTVRKGDSLWDIARTNGITIQEIMEWNSLASATVYPGMLLKVGL